VFWKMLRKSENLRKKQWRGQPKSAVTRDRRIECVGTVVFPVAGSDDAVKWTTLANCRMLECDVDTRMATLLAVSGVSMLGAENK
jgi:hypothetical protein